MKKVFVLLMLILTILMLTACTGTNTNFLTGFYDNETKQYHIKNVSSDDYQELVVYLVVENKNGYEKEIKYEIGNLDKGEEYIIDLSDMAEINRVYFSKYDYPINTLAVAMLIIFLALAVIGYVLWLFS